MIIKIPQIGTQITFSDLCSGYKGIFTKQQANFIKALSKYLPASYVYLVNSGTTAFYIILQALKRLSSKKEVILPAYTALAVVLPVLKTGLKPVLCDISLRDFNIDLESLPQLVKEDTLCVVPTHLFGIPVSGIEALKKKIPDVIIVEDCAQSMGTKIGGKNTGNFCDIAFLSFNRGKNLPTYGGGCIFTNSQELVRQIETEVDRLAEQSHFSQSVYLFKIMAFSLSIMPIIYGTFYPAISRFKDNEIPKGFPMAKFTSCQAGLGLSLLNRIEDSAEKRYHNAATLIQGLSPVNDIIVPTIPQNARPAFNRFPVVFRDVKTREKAEKALWVAGFDTSRMYQRPINHIFDLGYKKEDFPNAAYFAERLLTLPVHPLLKTGDLLRMIDVIRGTIKG